MNNYGYDLKTITTFQTTFPNPYIFTCSLFPSPHAQAVHSKKVGKPVDNVLSELLNNDNPSAIKNSPDSDLAEDLGDKGIAYCTFTKERQPQTEA